MDANYAKEPCEVEGGANDADIKQEPTDVDQTDPDDVTTQSIPEGSEQHEMEDIKYVNTQDYLDIGETVISEQDREMSEQDRARPGTSSEGVVKCRTNIHKNNGYQCRRCGSIKTHLGTCEICGYKCTTHSIRMHTGKKLYKCESCDYRCDRLGHLKEHMRTHTGEKPYKCESCDHRCNRLFNLKEHMRIHTGEKPYKCEICDYRCNQHSHIKRHMRTHTGQKLYTYKCESCDYQCNRFSHLKKHHRTHTGEKPYKSESCDYR